MTFQNAQAVVSFHCNYSTEIFKFISVIQRVTDTKKVVSFLRPNNFSDFFLIKSLFAVLWRAICFAKHQSTCRLPNVVIATKCWCLQSDKTRGPRQKKRVMQIGINAVHFRHVARICRALRWKRKMRHTAVPCRKNKHQGSVLLKWFFLCATLRCLSELRKRQLHIIGPFVDAGFYQLRLLLSEKHRIILQRESQKTDLSSCYVIAADVIASSKR